MITHFNSLNLEQTPVKLSEERYSTDKDEFIPSIGEWNNRINERSPDEKAAVEKLNKLALLLI